MNLKYFETNIFSHFEKKSTGSIQFNRKTILMTFLTKICIRFLHPGI